MDPFEGIEVYSPCVFLSPYFGSARNEGCRPEIFERVTEIVQQSIVAETTADSQMRNGNRSKVLLHLLGRLRGQGLPAAEFLEEYLREKYRRNCRSGTLKNTFSGILPFLKYLKRHGKSTVENIERRDVEAFIEHEQDRGLKVTSVRLRLLVLKAFFGYLKHRGAVADDVFPGSSRDKASRSAASRSGSSTIQKDRYPGFLPPSPAHNGHAALERKRRHRDDPGPSWSQLDHHDGEVLHGVQRQSPK